MSVVLYEVIKGVAIITLNRPEAYNAMSVELRKGLVEKISMALQDDCVRSVLLTNVGKAFCAGGDIKGFAKKENDFTAQRNDFLEMNKLVQDLYDTPKPVIVAVRGYAVGAGLSLALCGDLILCSSNAQFSAPFLRLGVGADMGLSFLAARRIGTERTKRLLLTGEMIDAVKAESWGLVDWVVEEESFDDRAFEIAKQVADAPSLAVSMTKTIMNQTHGSTLASILNLEVANQTLCFLSTDHAEGVQAFLEKRPPRFNSEIK